IQGPGGVIPLVDPDPYRVVRETRTEPNEPAADVHVAIAYGHLSLPRAAELEGRAEVDAVLVCDPIPPDDLSGSLAVIDGHGTRWQVVGAFHRPGLGLDHTRIQLRRVAWE